MPQGAFLFTGIEQAGSEKYMIQESPNLHF